MLPQALDDRSTNSQIGNKMPVSEPKQARYHWRTRYGPLIITYDGEE